MVGGMALAAMIASCTSEQENPEVDITAVRCNISRIDVEEDFATGTLDTLSATRGTFSGVNFLWSEGDKIGIVPTKGAQIYFSVNEGAGTSSALFEGGDWAMKSTGTFYAYYPLYPDIFLSKDHVSVSYTGQVQSGNNNNLHTGNYWTLYTNGTTAVGNTLNFTFDHLTSFFKTYVTVPAGTYTRITFSAPSEVFIKDGYFDLGAHPPVIEGTTFTDELCLELQNVTFTEETELTGYLVVAPVDITGIPITVTVYRDGEAAYEYTVTKESPMVAAKTYGFRATSLTPVVASVAQANALFASGETSVTITEPLLEDATVVLPNTEEAVSLTLPTTASTSTLTVSYAQDATAYPATLAITGPEGADLNIQAPNSTVTINGVSYDLITSRTAANTCIISEGVSVNVLKVVQGGVQVYGTVSQIDLSEQEDDAIVTVSGTVSSLLGEDGEEYIPATGITLSLSSINMSVGSTETLSAAVQPVGAYPQVRWASSDETVATVSTSGVVTAISSGITTIAAQTISEGFIAECIVSVIAEPDYVDLGLPSGTKWASRNLSTTGLVSSPEEYGDYFAWGEVTPKSSYNWSTYDLATSGEYGGFGSLLKYNTNSSLGPVDNLTTLAPNDDAACAILGLPWRMPSLDEAKELISNCDFVNTTLNGVDGYLVTSRINGNSIFLPTAQFWETTFATGDSGCGRYWLSSLYTGYTADSKYAYRLSIRPPSFSPYRDWDWYERYAGLSIRPVYGINQIDGISFNHSSLSLFVGQSQSLTASVSPSNATYKNLVWTSSDEAIASVSEGNVTAVSKGTVVIRASAIDGSGVFAECTVSVKPAVPSGAVDLGLSVYWASSNIGASNAVGYGNYYAWGELQPKETYTRANYLYQDHPLLLPLEHDVAHAIKGEGWRIPTKNEWRELIDNCTREWINLDGVNGLKFSSTVPGYTDKWVFIPAAGSYSTSLRYASYYGFYWTATSNSSSYSDIWYMEITDDSDFGLDYGDENGCLGYTVRPVYY